MLGTEFQEMLRCIRCAACMNHCPVYGAVGGHAYGWVYPGPMGSVLTPSLIGVDQSAQLPNASTFCGKCESVCPVKIPLPKMMRHWREREFERHLTPQAARSNLALWAWFARRPGMYRHGDAGGGFRAGRAGAQDGAVREAAVCGWLDRGAGPAGAARRYVLRAATKASRRRRSKARGMTKEVVLGSIRRRLRRGELPADQQAMLGGRLARPPRHLIPARSQVPRPEQVDLFVRNVEKEFGTVTRVPNAGERAGSGGGLPGGRRTCRARSRCRRIRSCRRFPWAERPLLQIREGRAEAADLVSVQHAFAAVAETGTLMFPSAPERPTTINLLPDTAVVVLRASKHRRDRMRTRGTLLRAEMGGPGPAMPRNVMLVTGPSRSADIEQTLELGAHGPRRLHVVLIEDDVAARSKG